MTERLSFFCQIPLYTGKVVFFCTPEIFPHSCSHKGKCYLWISLQLCLMKRCITERQSVIVPTVVQPETCLHISCSFCLYFPLDDDYPQTHLWKPVFDVQAWTWEQTKVNPTELNRNLLVVFFFSEKEYRRFVLDNMFIIYLNFLKITFLFRINSHWITR